MKTPTISVIIPVYNVEAYLSKCLDSVLNQDYKNLEIICIDDCSTDSSREILEKYRDSDNRIKIVYNPQNVGLGLTRNNGLKEATGEYIHFLDSDDWLTDNIYKKIQPLFDDKNIDLFIFRYNTYNEVTEEILETEYTNNTITNKILNPVNNPESFDNWDRYAWQKICKKDFLIANNIVFNNYRCMEDIEYAALLYTKANSIYYSNEIILNYRICRKNSLVKQAPKYIDNVVQSFENNRKLYNNLPDKLKYKLLGFDYFQIWNCINDTQGDSILSIPHMISIISKVNRPEIKYYKYQNKPIMKQGIKVRFFKYYLKKYFPKLFNIFVNFKKIFIQH